MEITNQEAPKVFNASLSSFTAVSASSKFNADIAHRACFCAFAIATSSVFSCCVCLVCEGGAVFCGGGGG